jgi:hypothetical protein
LEEVIIAPALPKYEDFKAIMESVEEFSGSLNEEAKLREKKDY